MLSRAGKVGDGIEARLGPAVRFLLWPSHISPDANPVNAMVSNSFPSVLRLRVFFTIKHETTIVYSLCCHASFDARVERTQDESPRRHSRSAERGECARCCGYY